MKTQKTTKENIPINKNYTKISKPIGRTEAVSELIKLQLYLRKIPQKVIVEALDVKPSAVSMFVDGKRKSKRFNQWVFENLGIAI